MDMLNDPSYGEADALLDDLMGNSTEFLPTPEPHYLGHQHKKFFNRVADQMDDYRRYQQQLLEARSLQAGRTDIMLPEPVELPTDKDVSFALRAFRDKNGTRQRPVGIVAALQHVLSDMGVPLSCLGEYSYTTLMMCARTPTEARRILQMMRENRVPPSAYAWTILCDVYAKTGDYQGCIAVQEEMLKTDGIAPTMASYTSLIAACYKVCMDGRIAHSIRAKAAEVAFEKWMEMRIVGACSNEGMTEEGVYSEGREHPDTMAYGAMLRIFAAQGQPERALSLLGEMQRFQIKPTTLCFTSALRAVARSHAVAVRYERGSSPRHRRREEITYHHGKLAREILIMAEGTGADHDQGFVAALCLCAAEAGDVATAKAIYLASQIRRLDQFRTVGPNSHLARLRGENVPVDYDSTNTEHVSDRQPAMLTSKNLAGENSSDIMEGDFAQEKMTTEDGKLVDLASGIYNRQQRAKYPSFGEREYGKDNRALTAILHACAKAADQNGMGTIWQGRENKGYLCINSLRLIKAIKLPRYRDKSIPGQTITDTMTWAGEQRDLDGYRPGKRRSRKFEGIDFVDDAAGTIDDLDDTFSKIFLDKDGRRKPEYRNATPDDIWRLKYGDDDDPRKPDNATANAQTAVAEKPPTNTDDDGIDSDEDAYFDALADELLGLDPSIPRPPRQEIIPKETYEDDEKFAQSTEEMYYDLESMSWKTRPKIPKTKDMTAHEIREEKEEKLFFHYDPKAAEVHDIESEEKFLELSEAAANDESGPESDDDSAEELYYDKDEMRWKTRTKAEAKAAANAAKMTRYEAKMYAKFTQKQQEVEDANLHQEPQAVDEACAPEPELEKEPDQLVSCGFVSNAALTARYQSMSTCVY
jgi:pentatricopeptide repeat protein